MTSLYPPPGIYAALQPLAKLPPVNSMFGSFDALTPLFTSPEFIEMAKHITAAGNHVEEFRKFFIDTAGDTEQLGFPHLHFYRNCYTMHMSFWQQA